MSTAEAVAVALLALPAAAVLLAYAADRGGLTIAPFVILVLALTMAAGVTLTLRRSARRAPTDLTAFTAIIVGVFVWLVWLAWPEMMPLGGGPDLTHHLQLIDYIQRHWRLVHDPTLAPYFGEMIDYTPGSHLLIALAGAWRHTDGVHAVHVVLAFTVALKVGFVFLIARRLLPLTATGVPFAVLAALFLFLSPAYLLESFTRHSFFAQVAGEVFVVGMWWALTVWEERPSTLTMALCAMWGAAAFLTWPVWVGPPLVALTFVVAVHRELAWRTRLTHLLVAIGPIAVVAVLHAAGRTDAVVIAGTSGYVQPPAMNAARWGLVLLGGAGLALAARRAQARVTPLLAGAIGLQAAALFTVARASAADTPYLALKMLYLAPFPVAVAASLALAAAWTAFVAPRRHLWAWAFVSVLAIAIVRPVAGAPRPHAIVSQAVYEAGQWARANLEPGCVDYFTTDSHAAYWLHVAVLGNLRASARTRDKDTFEQSAAIVRWILPGGLPYAIAEDFSALPKDLRTNVDVVSQFGPAAIIKRRGGASCADVR